MIGGACAGSRGMANAQIPETLDKVIREHVRVKPVRYVDYSDRGVEEAHLVTVPLHGRSYVGHMVSFSLNMADMRELMEDHGLTRIQSNEPGEVTLYFKGV